MSIKLTNTTSMKTRTVSAKESSIKDFKSSKSNLYQQTPQSQVFSRQNQEKYAIRFKSKIQLGRFQPGAYLHGQLTYDDIIQLKQVFDAYDSTGMGVLLPNDLKLLLAQNGFLANKKTVYEIVAQFDTEQTGGINFNQFMRAMDTKPFINQTKKQINAIFKKYDRANKGYIDLNDLREINRHLKENTDQDTLKLIHQKADSNRDGKISFDDFYSVMVKNYY